MFLKKKNAKKFTIPGGTQGWLFPSSPNKDQTIAYVEMDGIYPEKGYSVNDVATETICLVEGNMTVEVDGEKFNMKKGDVCMILPGKKYRVEGKGRLFDFITPAWEKNNNRIIEE